MKQRILAVLSRTDERLVLAGMVLLAALIAFEAWHLGLRTALAQYVQLRENHAVLAALVAASPRESREVGPLASQVQDAVRKVEAELRVPHSDDQLTAFLMTELDRSAAHTGITLKGVKPGGRRTVGPFEEVSYEVAAEGKYLMLCRWMVELERATAGIAGVTNLKMNATEDRGVAATLEIAVYRAASKGEQPK